MNTTMKSAAIGLLTLLAVTTGFTASASIEKGAELKAAGKMNDQPVYQLDLNNTVNAKFAIVIKDADGETLFQEVVSGVNISRKFQLNKEDLMYSDLRFEVIDLKTLTSSVFKVKNSSTDITSTEIVKN